MNHEEEPLQPFEEEVELPVDGIREIPDDLPPEPGEVPDAGHGLPGYAEEMPENDAYDEKETEL